MAKRAWAGLGQSQEPRIPLGSVMYVVGTQELSHPPAPSQDTSAGSWSLEQNQHLDSDIPTGHTGIHLWQEKNLTDE